MKKNIFRWSAVSIISLSLCIIAVLAVSTIFVSCKKDKATVNSPTLETTAVTNIASTTATAGGQIDDIGGAAITVSGVVYSTASGPTITDSYTTDGTTSGTYTSSLSELVANTTYYVRAYATNSAGTAYGSEVSFTTLP
jgi:hypothetical protein